MILPVVLVILVLIAAIAGLVRVLKHKAEDRHDIT